MLVQRDKNILRYLEEYHSITIAQCGQIFFNESIHYYDLARKRLKIIEDMGLIKHYTNRVTKEKVYYIEKKLSPHDLYLMNFYASLKFHKIEISEFIKECKFQEGKIRADGFFRFKCGGYERIVIVEVDMTHSTNIKKYEELYDTKEPQTRYGAFPLVVIIGGLGNRTYKTDKFDIEYLDYKLSGFAEKVLVV